MIVAIALTLSVYLVFLVWVTLGWELTKGDKKGDFPKITEFSIIIAIRNEEASIGNLLQCIQEQDYPASSFEVIVVDDHSSDRSFEMVSSWLRDKGFQVKLLKLESEFGKKSAIQLGISAASFPWIVTTDGDCSMGKGWLSSINEQIICRKPKMVLGPVSLSSKGSLFQTAQQMEFTTLIASAAAGIRFSCPNMCNGANLAFEKSAFYAVGGYQSHADIPSGDDEFFMHEVWNAFPDQVVFNKNPEGIVSTEASGTWDSFFNQRRRWASKWENYKNKNIKYLSVFVFGVQLAWVILFLLSVSMGGFSYFLIGYMVKTLADGFLIYRLVRWFGFRFHWVAFLTLEVCYPFYVVIFALVGRKKGYFWKGRNLGL